MAEKDKAELLKVQRVLSACTAPRSPPRDPQLL
jgi:hypothetical protein